MPGWWAGCRDYLGYAAARLSSLRPATSAGIEQLMIAAVKQSEPITLREYQQEAVDAVYDHIRMRDDNPCVVIPTGGGKTPVISTICHDATNNWGGRVIILAHVKELLDQTAGT